MFGHIIEQPSSWLDVNRMLHWPIQKFVYPCRPLTQSLAIIWPSSVDKASWSKMVHLRKVSGKRKYWRNKGHIYASPLWRSLILCHCLSMTSLNAKSLDHLTFIVDKASWSKMVHLRKVSGKRKYWRNKGHIYASPLWRSLILCHCLSMTSLNAKSRDHLTFIGG